MEISWWRAKGKLAVRPAPEASAEAVGDFLPEDIVKGLEPPAGEWLRVCLSGAIRFEDEIRDNLSAVGEQLESVGYVRTRNRFRELLVAFDENDAAAERWAVQIEERSQGISWLRPPPQSQAVAAQYNRPLLSGGAEEFERRWELQEVVTKIVASQFNLRTYGPDDVKDALRQHFRDAPPDWLEPLLSQKKVVVSMLSTAISQLGPVESAGQADEACNASASSTCASSSSPQLTPAISSGVMSPNENDTKQGEGNPKSGKQNAGYIATTKHVQVVPTPLRISADGPLGFVSLCTDTGHFTELLARLPWADYPAFAAASRMLAVALRQADWRRLLEVLSEEHGLLLPRLSLGHPAAPANVQEWWNYFLKMWSKRKKWLGHTLAQGFRVRAIARFRPGVVGSNDPSQIFLPLHQRLQLVKLGLDGSFQEEVARRMGARDSTLETSEMTNAENQKTTETTSEHDADSGADKLLCHARIVSTEDARVLVSLPGMGLRYFDYERVFDGRHSQIDVYGESALPAVEAFLEGFSSCVLCYGQTGSGKTHTMFGGLEEWAPCQEDGLQDSARTVAASLGPLVGMAPRALVDILASIEARAQQVSATLEISYVEIYQDHLTDLLSGNDVTLFRVGQGIAASEYRESAELGDDELYHLQGADVLEVRNAADALRALAAGEHRKHRAATALNARSSRAHAVLMLSLVQRFQGSVLHSRLHLVDLGGSEQVKKSQAKGLRFEEAVEINSSLLVLGRVVDALMQGRSHVPYYESKLTMLLQPALGGNAQTTVVITASPEDSAADETVHSLRFGERCARLTNSTHTATAPMAEVLASLQTSIKMCEDQIKALEAQGAADRAEVELGDKKLRGLGFGHGASRLVAQSHDDGTSGKEASLPAAGTYTMVEDLAGRWIAQHERLRVLKQRRSEILGH